MGFRNLALIILGALAGGWILWRLASRRRALPCPSWLGWFLENPLSQRRGTQMVLDPLDLKPGMEVLDMGCGPGRLSLPAARRIAPEGMVTGVDIQPGMIRRARQRASAAGQENVRFL